MAEKDSEVPTMPQMLNRAQVSSTEALPTEPMNSQRAVKILAKSLFRQLKDQGYQNRDVLALSTELVGLIASDLRPPEPR